MKKLFLFLLFSAFLAAQTNPDYNMFFSQPEGVFESVDSDAFYISGEAQNELNRTYNGESITLANPEYKWLHPSPIGTSMGTIKVWDANTVYAFGSGGTFVKTTDGGQTFSLNPFAGVPLGLPANTTYDIYGSYFFDMNTFYLCGALGVTKTTDGGQTFNAVGTGSITSGTARRIQFVDNNIGYIVGNNTVKMMKTTDAGATWTMNANLPTTTYYGLHVFDENKLIVGGFVSAGANIRITTNGGTTWTPDTLGNGAIYSFAFFDSLLGYAGSASGRGYKTTDGGFTWNQLTSLVAPSTSTFYEVFIKGTDVYFVEDDSLLFVTSDSGATFSTKRYLPLGKPNQIMRSGGFSGSNFYVIGDNGYFIKSTANGTTWNTNSKIVASGFVQGIYGDQTGKVISIGTSNPAHILVSDDFGQNFTPVQLSVASADNRSIHMFDATTGYTVGSGGRVWKTTNGGYNWDLYSGTTTIQAFNDVSFYNTQYGMVAGNSAQVWKTTDAGTTWLSVSNLGNTGLASSVAMIDSVTALVAGGFSSDPKVYKTTNGGTNWTEITPGVPIGPISRIRMRNSTVGYLVGASATSVTGFVFKTTNAGDTWVNMNFPYTSTMIYDIEFRNDSDYVVVGYGGSVFHTTNDGQSWKQYNLGLLNLTQSQVVGLAFTHQDTIIVGGAGTTLVKVTLDQIVPVELASFTAFVNADNISLTWTTATELNNRGFEVERKISTSNDWINLGFIEGRGTSTEPKTYVFQDFDVSSGRTYNYRIRQTDYDGSVTVYNLAETVTFGTPDRFELAQNYPNPFNPTTTIKYQLPENQFVKVEIFNTLGENVNTLVNQNQDAGEYSINWNGKSSSGQSLASGTYFYRIKAGSYVEVKKMMMIK